jgi:hypothetical protein
MPKQLAGFRGIATRNGGDLTCARLGPAGNGRGGLDFRKCNSRKHDVRNVVEKAVIEKAKVRRPKWCPQALQRQESVQRKVKNPQAVVNRRSEETEEGWMQRQS